MRSLILLALSLAVATAVPQNPQRIVGGSTTTISQYPSIVALLYSRQATTYWQACGGTIINTRSILSAAHCTVGDTANQWRVRVGSTYANSNGNTGVVHSVSQIVNHSGFSWNTYDNDICIIRTASTISYNTNTNAAFIASSTYNLGDNQVVWAAGWGTTSENGASSETLRHVQMWTVNQNTCRNNYATVRMTITDNMLCAGWLGTGGRDQCQGDSGGPLYHNNVLVGVCSFGYGCARAQFPGVNARVSRYASWISSNA